jgi:hypothetical protein
MQVYSFSIVCSLTPVLLPPLRFYVLLVQGSSNRSFSNVHIRHKPEESGDAEESEVQEEANQEDSRSGNVLTSFMRLFIIGGGTAAGGNAGLLVATTARSMHLFKTAGALVGFAVGTLLADWAVARVFSTFNRDKAPIVDNAKKETKKSKKDTRS